MQRDHKRMLLSRSLTSLWECACACALWATSVGFSRDRPAEVDAEDVSIETHSLMIAHSATAALLYSRPVRHTRLTLRVSDGWYSVGDARRRVRRSWNKAIHEFKVEIQQPVSEYCIPALHADAARHVMLWQLCIYGWNGIVGRRNAIPCRRPQCNQLFSAGGVEAVDGASARSAFFMIYGKTSRYIRYDENAGANAI